ncbi:MAG: transposase [Proteobacteria bacterium]|nr:transposase [Pseudomonadota bacterium]
MARPLRVELPGGLYLVTARSLPRQRLFRGDTEVADFLSRLPELTEAFGVACHGFCLLPDHYHLLLETPQPNLSRAVHRLNAGYTARVNAHRRRRGPLLQTRYRSLVLGEEWLVPLSVHVHLNPVRKRLTADPWSYIGSSARAYAADGGPVPGLTVSRVLDLAGGRMGYGASMESAMVAPPPAPWKQVWRQVALGGEELRLRVLAALEGRDVREIPGFRERPGGLSLEKVIALVEEQTGLPASELTSGKFQRVLARKVAIHLARRFTGCTLREIGDVFGVDYTTVHMATRRLEALRTQDPAVEAFVAGLEEQLRRDLQSTSMPGEAPSGALPLIPGGPGSAAAGPAGKAVRPVRRRRGARGQLDLF